MKKLALLSMSALSLHTASHLSGPLGGPAPQEVVPPSATLGAAELPPTPQATPLTGRVGHVRRP